MMNKEQLREAIDCNYKTRRGFIADFNKKAGFEALVESTLSRQLSGAIELSNAWMCAYKFFLYQ